MSFTNFSTGKKEGFGGKYHEVKPNALIKYTDVFDDPKMTGAMTNTIEFKEVCGLTDVTILQEGIPSQIPAEMCYLGWQESIALLRLLVEAEIPDGPPDA